MNFTERLIKKQFVDNNKTEYPDFKTACELAKKVKYGVIYACRNFFCVVWYENDYRFSRDLKNWGIKGKFLPKVKSIQSQYFQT